MKSVGGGVVGRKVFVRDRADELDGIGDAQACRCATQFRDEVVVGADEYRARLRMSFADRGKRFDQDLRPLPGSDLADEDEQGPVTVEIARADRPAVHAGMEGSHVADDADEDDVVGRDPDMEHEVAAMPGHARDDISRLQREPGRLEKGLAQRVELLELFAVGQDVAEQREHASRAGATSEQDGGDPVGPGPVECMEDRRPLTCNQPFSGADRARRHRELPCGEPRV